MATVICDMEKCKYRSKRPSRKWVKKSGEKCYGCTLEAISVNRIFDPDAYVIDVVGEDCMASCRNYTPMEE